MSFDYLLKRIADADFSQEPFKHLYIDSFFAQEDFAAITAAQEIAISNAKSDADLFSRLFANNYKIIDFPGCITDQNIYMDWHRKKAVDAARVHNNTACEGFGMTLRLTQSSSAIIEKLMAFLNGAQFQQALAQKFGVDQSAVFYDAGIQKYLDGYEISPHPDIRRKALTYMVNINPDANSEQQNHHTHYLSFLPEYRYVQEYWQGNPKKDRCWVPWDWCKTHSIQTRNNSMVIFAPANNTMHGVKADYNHLQNQRTQLYGNLWYHDKMKLPTPAWEDFVVAVSQKKSSAAGKAFALRQFVKSNLPEPIHAFVKQKILGRKDKFMQRF